MKRNEMMENRMNFQTSVELPAGMPSVIMQIIFF